MSSSSSSSSTKQQQPVAAADPFEEDRALLEAAAAAAPPQTTSTGGAVKRSLKKLFGVKHQPADPPEYYVVERQSTDTKEWLGAWAYGDAGEELVLEEGGRARATKSVATDASWRQGTTPAKAPDASGPPPASNVLEVDLRRPRFTPLGGFGGYAPATLRGAVVKRLTMLRGKMSDDDAKNVTLAVNATVTSQLFGTAYVETNVVTLTKDLVTTKTTTEDHQDDRTADDDAIHHVVEPAPSTGDAADAAFAAKAADIAQAVVAEVAGDEQKTGGPTRAPVAMNDDALKAALYPTSGAGDAVSYTAIAKDRRKKRRWR
mmetsp:Transcript_8904/g.36778  ORF Transcript_8904/g.36778 Transcript_8904/m.36778 type:complete len:317 (-) Transcript_8904:525-1475(-)